MIDEERMASLEAKLDRLLAALDKFAPLLDRLMSAGGVLGLATRHNPFREGNKHGRSDPAS